MTSRKIPESAVENLVSDLAEKANTSDITVDSLTNLGMASKSYVNAALPTGTIITWSTSTAPAGYLICDGSAISRTTYAALFSVIGTTYGEGDGNTTFNVPNCTNHTLWQGGIVGTSFSGSLPKLTGEVTLYIRAQNGSGVFSTPTQTAPNATQTGLIDRDNWSPKILFDSSKSKTAYSRGDNLVVPSGINIKFCIKY